MGRKGKKPKTDNYDNLILGLKKILSNNSNIKDFKFEKNYECQNFEITNWEERYNVKLPKDMENFYLSSDGFELTWNFQYTPLDIRPLGCLRIPHLIEITLLDFENDDIRLSLSSSEQHLIDGFLSPKTVERTFDYDSLQPKINGNTKIFEISQVGDLAKVFLFYENNTAQPQIYLFEMETYQWKLLAETFTQYLRMGIIHFGIPLWELCFSSYGIPPWVEQLFLVLAPHLLKFSEKKLTKSIIAVREKHYQKLDEKIFNVKLVKKKNYKVDGKK